MPEEKVSQVSTITQCPKFRWCVMGHSHKGQCSSTSYVLDAPVADAGPRQCARVFVDMDGVVVDFDSYKNALGLTGDEVKKRPGAYLNMKAYPEAIAGIKWLIGSGYEVWLATKPPTGISFAYADKAEWVFRNLPELNRRIVITHDKGILGDVDDFLIDDRPHKANCDKFKGTLIPFTNGETWDGVIAKLKATAPPVPQEAAPRCKACGHDPDRHEIEPPYPCFDCDCAAFSHVSPATAPDSAMRVAEQIWDGDSEAQWQTPEDWIRNAAALIRQAGSERERRLLNWFIKYAEDAEKSWTKDGERTVTAMSWGQAVSEFRAAASRLLGGESK